MGLTAVDQERAELERVLASPMFRKAPNQSRLLRYLCEIHIEGRTEQPKEHQIAIEALGRRDNFDGRENSIVRVEAWRLRRRLRQYYDTEGAEDPLRIVIDPGQYIARFDENVAKESSLDAPEPPPELPSADPSPVAAPRRWPTILACCVAALIAIAAVVMLIRRAPAPAAAPGVASVPDAVRSLDSTDEVRILAGYDRPRHIDRLGQVWRGDMYFTGGEASESPRQFIARTADPTIYQHCRLGTFEYNIPLKAGTYELRLYFGPSVRPWTVTDQQGPGRYPMTVMIGETGQVINLNFAPDGAAAPTADVRVFRDVSPGPNGKLHLGFWTAGQYAFVNAIEITPGSRGHLRPIRIIARDYFYTDRQGNIWPPDRFFRGGTPAERSDRATAIKEDGDLFSSERYGNFDYLIPVAQGTYAITMGFAEMWFGPKFPGGGGLDSRLFNVSCNGTALLTNFNVYREAGGAGKAIVRTVHGLHPDADGRLRLTFTAVRNNAMVNFIEVDDETK